MTNVDTTAMVMATMSDECRAVIDYCKTHAKKGVIYEGSLMNSICWNTCKKMYTRKDAYGYTRISLNDEEKAACNNLYKEVIHFLKARKNPNGYKEFMLNVNTLFITVATESIAVTVPMPVAPVLEEQPVVASNVDDLPPWKNQ